MGARRHASHRLQQRSGSGLGAIVQLARIEPGYYPYRYRLQAQGFFSSQITDGDYRVTSQAHFVRVDVPGLAGGWLRLHANLGFDAQANTGYYGIGPSRTAVLRRQRPSAGVKPIEPTDS